MRILVALLIASTAACSALHPADPKLGEMKSAFVELNYLDAAGIEQPYASGSAAPITADTYLTAAHVVEAPFWMESPVVRVNGSAVDYVTLLGDLDAALLVMLQPHGEQVWRADNRVLEPAEEVSISGWGYGAHWWSRGFATVDSDRLSITVAPGDSGCPVMDADMDIVGIIVAKDRRVGHHTYIVPITAIIAEIPMKVIAEMRLARPAAQRL